MDADWWNGLFHGVADEVGGGDGLEGDGVDQGGVVRAAEADVVVGPALHELE